MARIFQTALPLRSWGGERKGAGGRPKGARALVSHAARERTTRHLPVHVTMSVRDEVPGLRRAEVFPAVRAAIEAATAGRGRGAFSIVVWSVQGNHLHLVVEADGRTELSRGVQGLAIRIARAVNRAVGRRGKVFADRFHEHVLRTPAEARNAVAYVLENFARHEARRWVPVDAASRGAAAATRPWADPCSSRGLAAPPRTWLLRRACGVAGATAEMGGEAILLDRAATCAPERMSGRSERRRASPPPRRLRCRP